MKLSNLKLGTKIGLLSGILLILMALVATIGVTSMDRIHEKVGVIVGTRVNQLEMLFDLMKTYDSIARSSRNLALTKDEKITKSQEGTYQKNTAALSESLNQLEKTLTTEKGKELFAQMRDAVPPLIAEYDKAVGFSKAGNDAEAAQSITVHVSPLHSRFIQSLNANVAYVKAQCEKERKESQELSDQGRMLVIVLSIAAIILGAGLAYLLTRSITNPLNRAIAGLSEGSEQVATAARQVSASSQQLAEGSSEQAASLEETSSSLEELSSMTKQNAGNSEQAKAMMAEVREIVEKANSHMESMVQAISEITKSSEETGKIIKTIDEIAFQTNLLALNAAVEAARAGEAGAGFAVVADEVRNLALRASDAAKNTSGLIEGTIKAVRNGNELTSATQKAFQENAGISRKVGQLVDEIAAASEEQSQGIGQVGKAVQEMDKVTQSTAANAEESASAAEELNAQAEQMKGYVGELVKVVIGGAQRASAPRPLSAPGPARKAMPQRGYQVPVFVGNKSAGRQLPLKGGSALKVTRPDQVIPLEEGDFKDF